MFFRDLRVGDMLLEIRESYFSHDFADWAPNDEMVAFLILEIEEHVNPNTGLDGFLISGLRNGQPHTIFRRRQKTISPGCRVVREGQKIWPGVETHA